MQVILVHRKGDIVATVKQLLIQLLVTKLYSNCGTMNEISTFHSALIIPLKMIALTVDSTAGKKKKRAARWVLQNVRSNGVFSESTSS